MNVYLPYTNLDQRVLDALNRICDPTIVYVGQSDTAYFDLLDSLWRTGETFYVVEHDVVVNREALVGMERCPRDWCSVKTLHNGAYYPSLGCVKFTDKIIERNSDMFDVIAQRSDELHPPKHWCRIDRWSYEFLVSKGELVCAHRVYPQIAHLRPDGADPMPSHGCEVAA